MEQHYIRNQRLLSVAMALMIILSGCGGSTSTQSPTSQTETPDVTSDTTSPTATSNPTETETLTSGQTPTPPDNPWNVEVIMVAIDDSKAHQSIRPEVRSALQFWQNNTAETRYSDVQFMLTTNTDVAQIVVRVEDSVDVCGLTFDEAGVGCAPLPGEKGFDGPVTVHIEKGYTADSRETIVKHEIGHVLGLDHDSSLDIMAGEQFLTTLPQTDAVNKPNPWDKSTISVAVNYSAVPQPILSDHRQQVSHAFDYYRNGAEGFLPENMSIKTVDSPSEADITVTFGDRETIGDRGELSNASVYGTDSDDDGRLETFTSADIRLAYDVEGEYGITSYSLGFWLAYSLIAPQDEYPPPWEDDDITRKDEWWTRR